MTQITATEASRNFSDLLNRVSSGERVEITRAGIPVAVIEAAPSMFISADHFHAILESAPSVDADFVEDLKAIRREAGPEESRWPS